MSEEEYDAAYCVTCPRCGKVQKKVYETDSVLRCGACRFAFYVFQEGGFRLEVPADWIADRGFVNRMRAFVSSAGCGHGLIRYDAAAAKTFVRQETISQREQDMAVLRAIQTITQRGNSAEIKKKTDGSLTVYEVRKSIAVK